MNFTTQDTAQKLAKHHLKFLLVFIFLLTSNRFFAQSPSGISIVWTAQVGCQVFANEDDPRGDKGSIFLEDITDSVCIKVCEKSKVDYTILGNLGNNTINWTVIGGTIIWQDHHACGIEWSEFGQGFLMFEIINNRDEVVLTKSICIEKIIKPIANFTILPFPNNNDTDELISCAAQTITFTN